MDQTNSQDDAIINRINLQLARSRSILSSWRLQSEAAKQEDDDAVDDDDDFKSFGEKGGIGSKVTEDDESLLPTRRAASKDKLLEQLIGKKAANAKRKEDAHKSMSVSKHNAPKPLTGIPKQSRREEDSDDEEEGRAAAFKSKASRKQPVHVQLDEDGAKAHDPDARDEFSSSGSDSQRDSKAAGRASTSESGPKPQKRKAGGSYLDELLSKKAKKKSKKAKG